VKTGILLMLLFFLVIRAVAQSKDTLLPEVTVKGTLTNKSGFKSTSIDSLMLALHSNTDLARLLSSSSTVFVKTYGPGNLATTSFRGAAAHHTEVLWEGISIKYPMSGQIDFSLIPVGAFDQVELFHGPGSLNNVTGALGGSINLSSSPDWNNKLCAAITQRAASYDNHSTNAVLKTGNDRMQSHSKLFIHTGRNDFPFRNITLAEQPVQTVQNAKQLQYNVLQDIFLSINRKNIISVRSWYQWSDREIPSPMTTSSAEEKQR
jgi:vitamin B12 transporter